MHGLQMYNMHAHMQSEHTVLLLLQGAIDNVYAS